jgi:hypothetical protein
MQQRNRRRRSGEEAKKLKGENQPKRRQRKRRRNGQLAWRYSIALAIMAYLASGDNGENGVCGGNISGGEWRLAWRNIGNGVSINGVIMAISGISGISSAGGMKHGMAAAASMAAWRHQSSAYGGVMAASTAYHERNGGENISVAAAKRHRSVAWLAAGVMSANINGICQWRQYEGAQNGSFSLHSERSIVMAAG